MSLKSYASKIYARMVHRKIQQYREQPCRFQDKIFHSLISRARKTAFGQDHHFASIKNYQDYKQRVSVRDYEQFVPYIERVRQGEKNILWPGLPLYLAKTSGTTSGVKYIPITKESIKCQVNAAKYTLLSYIHHSGKTAFVNGNMIFLQGSPVLKQENGIKIGRLSGIVAHYVPDYLKRNRLPSFETNCIEDWEEKLDAIIDETLEQNMALVSGIPPWVKMYFERLLERTGKKTIAEVLPDLSLIVHGGVNFEPYQKHFEALLGKDIDMLETYPASEGFVAYQDDFKDKSLLLNVDGGIFYEFIPLEDYFSDKPTRISIEEVEVGVNYVILISSNAGLWSYNIGDTVKFVSLFPHKIIVTGRIKHFISTFGEHVILEEIESALAEVSKKYDANILEFTVAPFIDDGDKKESRHEWYIESEDPRKLTKVFQQDLDEVLQRKNIYYRDIRQGNIIQELKIIHVRKNAFVEVMKKQGKLGGQNKVPHVKNDRDFAQHLCDYIVHEP